MSKEREAGGFLLASLQTPKKGGLQQVTLHIPGTRAMQVAPVTGCHKRFLFLFWEGLVCLSPLTEFDGVQRGIVPPGAWKPEANPHWESIWKGFSAPPFFPAGWVPPWPSAISIYSKVSLGF